MKKALIASIALNVLLAGAMLYAGLVMLPAALEAQHATRTIHRTTQFDLTGKLNPAGGIVFVGDSITEGGAWSELFPGSDALNRGIGGDTTADVLARLDQVRSLEPGTLFLMIGINDLNKGMPQAETFANLERIFDKIDARLPATRVYVQSVLPTNSDWLIDIDPDDIAAINEKLIAESSARGYEFIDLRAAFTSPEGELHPSLSADGIHLRGEGYALWRERIAPLVAAATPAQEER